MTSRGLLQTESHRNGCPDGVPTDRHDAAEFDKKTILCRTIEPEESMGYNLSPSCGAALRRVSHAQQLSTWSTGMMRLFEVIVILSVWLS